MKEIPILFSTPMIQALMDGRKQILDVVKFKVLSTTGRPELQ